MSTLTPRTFVRDWVIFAPVALWLALILSVALRKNLIVGELSSGAALTYAMAVSYAFLEDLPLTAWEESNGRWRRILAFSLPLAKYFVSLMTTSLLTLILCAQGGTRGECSDSRFCGRHRGKRGACYNSTRGRCIRCRPRGR